MTLAPPRFSLCNSQPLPSRSRRTSTQVPADSYRNTLGSTIDSGGFTVVAANPPTPGDVGTWVLDAVTDIERGVRYGAEHYFLDPLDNPHMVHAKLLALRSKMTQHDFDTQIRGKMLQLPDRVLYTWDQAVNERSPPDFGKVTHDFLTAHEGDRAPWNNLITVDVQSFPFIACGVFTSIAIHASRLSPQRLRRRSARNGSS